VMPLWLNLPDASRRPGEPTRYRAAMLLPVPLTYGASEPMSKRNDLSGARRNDRQRYTVFAAGLIGLMFAAVALGTTSWVEAFGVALALAVISIFD
jgi:hypothetical protein